LLTQQQREARAGRARQDIRGHVRERHRQALGAAPPRERRLVQADRQARIVGVENSCKALFQRLAVFDDEAKPGVARRDQPRRCARCRDRQLLEQRLCRSSANIRMSSRRVLVAISSAVSIKMGRVPRSPRCEPQRAQ
jgi:hypothetical protein